MFFQACALYSPCVNCCQFWIKSFLVGQLAVQSLLIILLQLSQYLVLCTASFLFIHTLFTVLDDFADTPAKVDKFSHRFLCYLFVSPLFV